MIPLDETPVDYGNKQSNFIRDCQGNKLGQVVYCHVSEYLINIDLIEVDEPHKGHHVATNVINYFKQQGYSITGDCLPTHEAISFWLSVGAVFDGEIADYIGTKSCIPFIIE